MCIGFRIFAVKNQGKSAGLIVDLVISIAAYNYFRIFDFRIDACEFSAGTLADGAMHKGFGSSKEVDDLKSMQRRQQLKT